MYEGIRINMFFLFLHKKHMFWYSLEVTLFSPQKYMLWYSLEATFIYPQKHMLWYALEAPLISPTICCGYSLETHLSSPQTHICCA